MFRFISAGSSSNLQEEKKMIHSATSDKQIRKYFTRASQKKYSMDEMRDIYHRGRDDFTLSSCSTLTAFHKKRTTAKSGKRIYRTKKLKDGSFTLFASRYIKNPKTNLYNQFTWRVVKRNLASPKDAEGWKYLDSLGGRPF